MPDLKIPIDDIASLLPNEESADLEEVFSFIAWSVICEPGDGLAGLLVKALGAANALSNELQNAPVEKVRAQIIDAGFSNDILDKHGRFEKALLAGRERWRPRMSQALVREAIYQINKVKGFVLTPISPDWPSQLSDLGFHEPMAIWVRGSLDSLRSLENSVAIVGCRGSSSYGEYATQNVVSSLVEKGISVISGGAYGIDGVAHRSVLALRGNTVAVMAGGVDRLYPTGHADLLKRISETGAVISELPPGSIPSKWRFLQRNRLIAALSQATLVVEANWRSGSLNTVGHAEQIHRDVFAIPGPISSPKSAGTNKLIADRRAELVVDGRDFLERLGVELRVVTAVELAGLGAIEKRVLDAIGYNALEVAEICAEAGLTRDEAKFGLGLLELEGLVQRRNNTWTRLQTTV